MESETLLTQDMIDNTSSYIKVHKLTRKDFGILLICMFCCPGHCSDVIKCALASQITSISTVLLSLCSSAHQKENNEALRYRPLWGESTSVPQKRTVTRKMFPFDDVIMNSTWNMFNTVLLLTFHIMIPLSSYHMDITVHGFIKSHTNWLETLYVFPSF